MLLHRPIPDHWTTVTIWDYSASVLNITIWLQVRRKKYVFYHYFLKVHVFYHCSIWTFIFRCAVWAIVTGVISSQKRPKFPSVPYSFGNKTLLFRGMPFIILYVITPAHTWSLDYCDYLGKFSISFKHYYLVTGHFVKGWIVKSMCFITIFLNCMHVITTVDEHLYLVTTSQELFLTSFVNTDVRSYLQCLIIS